MGTGNRARPDVAGDGTGHRTGPVARLRPGHRRDAPEPRTGGLADVAPHARRLGLQPAGPDRPRERGRAADGLVARPDTGQQSGHAAGLWRRHVHAEPGRRDPGHRCRQRWSAVGIPPGASRGPGGAHRGGAQSDQPKHRHPRHPDHRHQRRRLRLRPRGHVGPAGVGNPDPRLQDASGAPVLRPDHCW